MTKTLTLCAAALLVAGCVPIPHMKQVTPELDGILTSQGVPLADVRVRSCVDGASPQACGAIDETTTDTQGRFHLQGRESFAVGVAVNGDPSSTYRIEVVQDGRTFGWSPGAVGYTRHVALRCELAERLNCTHEP